MNRRQFLLTSASTALEAQLIGAARALRSDSLRQSSTLQDKLMHDLLRPQFHLLPQAGFLGDPCAPRFHEGNYHAFFHGSYGGRGWAHAMSADLVHWTHMPIALSPGVDGYDSYGTFTGGVLSGGEGASIIYTGVTKVPREQETIRNEGLREVQCIATSRDKDLRAFHKRQRPIIEGPPPGIKVTGFRDPVGWIDGDTWYALIGSGFPQVGGAVLLYRSKDMERWEYVHPLAKGVWNGQSFSNPVPSGEMWECPDFFPLGDKHVLLYSTEHATWWEVGSFDRRDLRFYSEKKGILDQGAYYAPRSFHDDKGRRILWGWVQETRSQAEVKQAGWGGCMSLPRVLTLAPDNALRMEVADEVYTLRKSKLELHAPQVDSEVGARLAITPISNRAGHVQCRFRPTSAPCTLDLRLGKGPNARSLFNASYSQTSGAPFIGIGDRLIPMSPHRGLSTVNVWIDGSVIETFIDNKQVMTTRCYVEPGDSSSICCVWTGPTEAIEELSIADVMPISNDRLTS
jgi:beta-fructofuranosidase